MWNDAQVNVMRNDRMDDLNGGLYNGLAHYIIVSPHAALGFPIKPWINIYMFVNKNSTNEVYLEFDGILPICHAYDCQIGPFWQDTLEFNVTLEPGMYHILCIVI